MSLFGKITKIINLHISISMPEPYIESITIKNFRAFSSSGFTLNLAIPDKITAGSGLTILIGENGCGKTTVLESIDLLLKNTFSARNKIEISDFNDKKEEIEVIAKTTPYQVKRLWGTNEFPSNGIRFHSNIRSRNDSRRLVDPIVVDNEFVPIDGGPAIQAVELRIGASGPYGTDRTPLKVHYFDKNRARHLKASSYQNQLDTIIGDLNFQYLKWFNAQEDSVKTAVVTEFAERSQQLIENVNDKVIETAFEKIRSFREGAELFIDPTLAMEPFAFAGIYTRSEVVSDQISVAKLGSGLEMICALMFLETVYSLSAETAVYCIDEPELHLHPQHQRKLLRYLKELAISNQVVISTHSPNFFSMDLLQNVRKFSQTTSGIQVFTAVALTATEMGENTKFFERHRDLFFAQKAIFVEGKDDIACYHTFLIENGMEHLADCLYMMSGKGLVRFFERFCDQFGITFAGFVDKDFSYSVSSWHTSKLRKILQRLERDYPTFRVEDLYASIPGPTETPKGGADAPTIEKTMVEGSEVEFGKATNGNIYYLLHGEIEDYFNVHTKQILNDDHKAELIAVFQTIDTL